MQLDYLADHQEFLPTLADWHHQEWGHLRPADSVEARVERLRAESGHKQIPTTVIAFRNSTLLGSAMLIAHDMDTRMELSPWLASVFVAPESRRQGIGAALVRRIVEEAGALGVVRLYLYTTSKQSFYSRLGWSFVERASYHGADVIIMSKELLQHRG